jgi:hypothetical protein
MVAASGRLGLRSASISGPAPAALLPARQSDAELVRGPVGRRYRWLRSVWTNEDLFALALEDGVVGGAEHVACAGSTMTRPRRLHAPELPST